MKNPLWERVKSTRAEYKEKGPKRSMMWQNSNKSKVPLLNDHRFDNENPLIMRDVKVSEKANHFLNNIFHESHLQK